MHKTSRRLMYVYDDVVVVRFATAAGTYINLHQKGK